MCRKRNDVLWDALANHLICNVLSFNTCSTIFTKSRARHVIVHVQQSRRNLEQHLSLTPERHLPAVVWRGGLLRGGEGGLLGALRDSVGKFKRNRCKCVGSDWRRGRVVTFCLYCRGKQFWVLRLWLDDLCIDIILAYIAKNRELVFVPYQECHLKACWSLKGEDIVPGEWVGCLRRKQDHQWWRYHRRLFDYQSPYF